MSFGVTQQSGGAVKIKDEGVTLVNSASSIDFAGGGVTGTAVGNDVTETIPGGGAATVTVTYEK